MAGRFARPGPEPTFVAPAESRFFRPYQHVHYVPPVLTVTITIDLESIYIDSTEITVDMT